MVATRMRCAGLPLRLMRETAEKTQTEMAKLLRTSQGEISRLERRDNVEIATVRAYARALGFACQIVCTGRQPARTRAAKPVTIIGVLVPPP